MGEGHGPRWEARARWWLEARFVNGKLLWPAKGTALIGRARVGQECQPCSDP